jgi:hypothetical protein
LWPAAGCQDGVDPLQFLYPNHADSWLVYGPFSLADAASAQMNFSLWAQLEEGYDFLYWAASVDGVNFSGEGITGNSTNVQPPTSQGWLDVTFDLSDVVELGDLTGRPQVWVAFIFQSDGSNSDDGPFLDDVLIQKRVASTTATPTPTSAAGTLGGKNVGITPGNGAATVIWDGGSLQNGYLTARFLPSLTILPPGLLPANATSQTDSGLGTGTLYCYLIGPTTGNPPALAGISNLACIIANTRSAIAAPQNFTLRVTQSGNADLTWTGPLGGGQDAFRIISTNGDVVDVSGSIGSRSFPLSGFQCFMVIAMKSGVPMGNTDIACGASGVSTLGS